MKKLLRIAGGPLLVLCVLLGSLWLLHAELRQFQLRDFLDGLAQIPSWRLWLAVVLTVVNYLILIGYDVLGVTYLGHPLQLEKVALGSFLGYAVGNNFGTVLGGTTVRYRLYSSWGLSALDIVKLVLILGVTFWIGLFALAGVLFVCQPLVIPPDLRLPIASTQPLGWVLCVLSASYLALCAFRRKPVRIGNWAFTPPPLLLSLMQYAVATMDLMVAAGVLYVLLPHSIETTYFQFLGVYLLAIVASLITQVPGGLGVLELVMVVFLNPAEPQVLIGSLLAFRAVYYLIPLLFGLLALGLHELSLHGTMAQRAIGALGNLMSAIGPRILSVSVFGAGLILLFTAASPPPVGRMELVGRWLPLAVIELSHFLAGAVGVLLLILALGLQRRIETAYFLTAGLLGLGAVLSLSKGLGYEEALTLSLLLAVFLPSRSSFYRKDALITERFTLRWVVSFIVALVGATWLSRLAYKEVDSTPEVWWQFALDAHAARSYRALLGASVVGVLTATIRMLRRHSPLPRQVTKADMQVAAGLVERCPRTLSRLALLGDKRFLFSRHRDALIMYGVEANSYVAMGDPVGPRQASLDLAWDFYEHCDAIGAWPVFYQVDAETSLLYVEMGLSLTEIGEEARVPLASFSLEGGSRRELRATSRRVAESGCTFRIETPQVASDLMVSLKEISDDWLSQKQTAEKGFSLGFFEPEYIAQSPVAIVELAGRPIAFANLWLGAGKEEMAVDLMRYRHDVPPGVMEYLFVQLMSWGQTNGYQWIDLGMAPPVHPEAQPQGPRWNQLASVAFRHGEHFYNFEGLRQYMSQFDPVWTTKYLASPGGLALPAILSSVATLISGGVRRVTTP